MLYISNDDIKIIHIAKFLFSNFVRELYPNRSGIPDTEFIRDETERNLWKFHPQNIDKLNFLNTDCMIEIDCWSDKYNEQYESI